MKRILIISDNFSRGGLETQIYTFYKELKDKASFTFAFGNYNNEWDFGKSKIYTNLKFNETASINQFIEVVEELVKIIKKNKIDVIHVHPFYLTIPAIFASEITRVPICYTFHGYTSFSFANTINFQTLFTMSINELFSKIFFVRKSVIDKYEKNLKYTKTVFLPNPIDLSLFKKTEVSKESKWVMSCRLSSDKNDAMIDIIDSIDSLGIKELHLYGSGDAVPFINDYITKKKLQKRVYIHGYRNDINKVLTEGYTGVIGMGRSAAEAIAMQMPVLLIGYGKNCGLINKNNFKEAFDNNYVPLLLNVEKNEVIKKQIEEISKNGYKSDIYDEFSKRSSSKVLAKQYLKELSESEPNVRSNVVYLYRDIKKLNSNECFGTSQTIFDLICFYLKDQYQDITLNTIVTYYNDNKRKINEIYSRLNELDNKIKQIPRTIHAKYIVDNTFNKIKDKFKKK